jgi:ubiquinone/menaquinone biosynthesis C-methylase UbiE
MLHLDPHDARSRDYYDRLAPQYDSQVDTELIRGVRECFWHHAEDGLQPGSRILDFGAGTGWDAEHFAALGHHVTAYDLSGGMLERLRERCADAVAAGRVVTIAGTLDELADALRGAEPFNRVICNFAVLSMIPDPARVLGVLARVLRPGGRVLISIQRAWSWKGVPRRAFLKALLLRPWRGVMRYDSADVGTLHIHTRRQIENAAHPDFTPLRPTLRDCCPASFGRSAYFELVALERK